MPKAVIYTRVSTEEQKNLGFSLADQYSRLLNHCKHKGYDVIKHYEEDHSAKSFNRPEFQAFLEDLKSKRITPDVFVCIRMDRFSRNARETFDMFDFFASKGIRIEFVEGDLNMDSPENMLPFFVSVVMPEIENRRRGLNTKRGMRQALKEGRWTGKAPFGYLNDKINKLVIVDKKNAHFVQESFDLYSKGIYSANEVRKNMSDKGFKLSKQNFFDMLSNPFYIGKIRIKAWDNEPEQLVNGIHDPLISEDVFYCCGQLLRGKRKPYQGKTNSNELPLKGFLICQHCGKPMTGSASKGNGGLYHYYHCQRKYGCKNSYKALEANNEFVKYLASFNINKEVYGLYEAILEDVFKVDDYAKEKQKKDLETEIDNVDKKLHSLHEKFIDDLIEATDYKELKNGLSNRKNDLIIKHATITKMDSDFKRYLSFSFSLLRDLPKYYEAAPTPIKGKIIGSIFPEKLIYSEKDYRTTKPNEVLSLLINGSKEFKQKQSNKNVELSSWAPQSGLEPETL